MTRDVMSILFGALLLAATSTLGDFVWATWVPAHRPAYGLIHGAALFLVLGGYLGALAHRPALGGAGGAGAGVLGAAGFYLLAPVLGYAAMFPMWVAVWLLVALLNTCVLRLEGTVADALSRGAIAALGSGLAFYAISGIWLDPPPTGPRYARHFAAWTVAFLPGFAALLVRRGSRPGPDCSCALA